MSAAPNTPLLAYYADDFTGSTDVMEALSSAGIETALFLEPPNASQLARFPSARAFGVAGGSRTMSPASMRRALPEAFEALRRSGAPIVHYKICSTFDSSPETGSIGLATELGRAVFGAGPTPMVVGAPPLGRHVVFGNLFARSGLDSEPHRLDRHPTMRRHPVTPMRESDLRRVLAKQTKLPVALVDVLRLDAELGGGEPGKPRQKLIDEEFDGVVLFDTLRGGHLAVIGRAIAEMSGSRPRFVVGSSGVEYALAAHWGARGAARAAGGRKPGASQILCVSGSCSPVTDRQIALGVSHGLADVPATIGGLMEAEGVRDLAAKAEAALRGRQGVVIHTSRGVDDPRRDAGMPPLEKERLGRGLGRLLEALFLRTGLRRAVVCGGDTSTWAARALGIEALEYLGPMAPGSPLCRVHAPGRVADGREIIFKGGQVGRDRFFLDALAGQPGDGETN